VNSMLYNSFVGDVPFIFVLALLRSEFSLFNGGAWQEPKILPKSISRPHLNFFYDGRAKEAFWRGRLLFPKTMFILICCKNGWDERMGYNECKLASPVMYLPLTLWSIGFQKVSVIMFYYPRSTQTVV
jgi:hypothetical protein